MAANTQQSATKVTSNLDAAVTSNNGGSDGSFLQLNLLQKQLQQSQQSQSTQRTSIIHTDSVAQKHNLLSTLKAK